MTAPLALTANLPDLLGTSPADLIDQESRHDSTRAEALERAGRLRAGIVRYAEMRQDIADAFACRDWVALGYDNWPAYIAGEFGEQIAQLARNERREAVADFRSQGMSTRQIAESTGMPQSTVSDTVRQLTGSGQLSQPERITGADGKDRPASRPTAAPKPDLKPAILAALAGADAKGLTLDKLADALDGSPSEKDLRAALDVLDKAGEIVVTATWATGKPRRWALTPAPAALSTAPAGTGEGTVPAADGCPTPAVLPQGPDPVTSVAAALDRPAYGTVESFANIFRRAVRRPDFLEACALAIVQALVDDPGDDARKVELVKNVVAAVELVDDEATELDELRAEVEKLREAERWRNLPLSEQIAELHPADVVPVPAEDATLTPPAEVEERTEEQEPGPVVHVSHIGNETLCGLLVEVLPAGHTTVHTWAEPHNCPACTSKVVPF
jgi:hypothetical protein